MTFSKEKIININISGDIRKQNLIIVYKKSFNIYVDTCD